MQDKTTFIVGIDPGPKESGITVLENGKITYSTTAHNAEIFGIVKRYKRVGVTTRVRIEGIAPYRGQVSPFTINTIEYIGELKYRLKTARISYMQIFRSTVRSWCYAEFRNVCIPAIDKIVIARVKKGITKINKDGKIPAPSFVYMNDRIVADCMRKMYGLEDYKGKSNPYGVSSHGWQALALASISEMFLKEWEEERKRKDAAKNRSVSVV